MSPVVEFEMIQFDTVADGASPKVALYSTPTPATWGEAIDVPESEAVVPARKSDTIAEPAAPSGTCGVVESQQAADPALSRTATAAAAFHVMTALLEKVVPL